MPARQASELAFDYTIIRVVPRVERQEFVNVGVILFCKQAHFLDAKVDLSASRVAALSPHSELTLIRARLELIPKICTGESAIDTARKWTQSERFAWLAAPKSTVIQASPAHRGLCSDPANRLESLYQLFVA